MRFVSSFSLRAPTYVQAERTPPRISWTVSATGTAVFEVDRLAFGSTVFGDTAGIFIHGRFAAHAVEGAEDFAVLFYDFAAAFIVAGEHAAEHHEVCAAAESLGDISRSSAAAV